MKFSGERRDEAMSLAYMGILIIGGFAMGLLVGAIIEYLANRLLEGKEVRA